MPLWFETIDQARHYSILRIVKFSLAWGGKAGTYSRVERVAVSRVDEELAAELREEKPVLNDDRDWV